MRILSHDGLATAEPSAEVGARPRLQWISKDGLFIDETYQRTTGSIRQRAVINKILSEFNWSKFQPITVVFKDGNYIVIDGQHRAIAAMAHPLVTEIPCWVVNAQGARNQARIFVGVNTDRIDVTYGQKFKSRIASGDPIAARVAQICENCGIALQFNNGMARKMPPLQTQAMGTLEALLKEFGEDHLTRVLAVLAAAYPDKSGQLRSEVIKGISIILRSHKNIDEDRLIAVLSKLDCCSIMEQARSYKTLNGGSTDEAVAGAITQAYDRRLQGAKRLRVAA